jgi:hypothetical protein
MFTLMHSDVMRIQLYVSQSEAFGLAPHVDAVLRVPEIPDRTCPAKVAPIADALQLGTRTCSARSTSPIRTGRSRPLCMARSSCTFRAEAGPAVRIRRMRGYGTGRDLHVMVPLEPDLTHNAVHA